MLLSLTLLLGACGGKDEIVISGKPWTEQFILPHILGQYIEAETDYKVKYKDGLGEVAIMTPALEKGDIDLYVEYTGTGLKDVLKEESKAGESSESVFDRVKKGYEDKFEVTWLEPLGFENGYTLAFTKDKEYKQQPIPTWLRFQPLKIWFSAHRMLFMNVKVMAMMIW